MPTPSPLLAPTTNPRLLRLQRRGAKLTSLQGRCFDLISEAGEGGLSSKELHHEIYRQSRKRRIDAIVQLIDAINRRLEPTSWRLVSRPGRFARWRLQQTMPVEESVITSDGLDRGPRKMSGARQRYYEGLPRDVAKQERLEQENRKLQAENASLRSVVATIVRVGSPYVSKAEPSRTLTRPHTVFK
jgi:hypothetical protein